MLPYGTPLLSDLELRYPFAPRSRRFFESIPVEESLASKEVVDQARSRLLSSLGRAKYETSLSELVEFSSFFASALVASQDPVLSSQFSKREGERAKGYFVRESPANKATIMAECFGANIQSSGGGSGRESYTVPFEGFLALVSRYELSRNPTWKLSRQELDGGIVRMGDNLLNDLFGDCALAAVGEGVRNLRKAPLPGQLNGVREEVLQYVPSPRPRTNRRYQYIEALLEHPVSDGRHRIVWLLLAPMTVNVLKLDDGAAIEKIRAFVQAAGETSAMRRFIEYNVRRARRNGLLPPTFSTLKKEHPDIYALLPKEAMAAELGKGKNRP